MKQAIPSILLSALWISISEFVRNAFLLHKQWQVQYQKLGLIFPEQPVNGAIWGLWSLCFAVFIYILSQKFSLFQTTLLSWFAGFIFMWLVIGNLGVLPFGILPLAIPLSVAEAFVASLIIKKLNRKTSA